jgi:alpha-tubulin suppressor-like RCC1 family protein
MRKPAMCRKEPDCGRLPWWGARRCRAARTIAAAGIIAGAGTLAATLLATATAMPAAAGAAPAARTTPASTPRPAQARHTVRAAATGAVSQWIHISAGEATTCGIRVGNTLWCWGDGSFGELGTGHTTNANLPQQVTKRTAGWNSIAAGGDHPCATRSDGTLWCWGYNDFGQLGIGNTISQDLPQQVTTPASTGWTSAAAGAYHTCAARSDGTLWCWGYNGVGQLGIGNTTSQDLPQQVTSPAADGWASVTAGYQHTCAARSDTTLWCWGYNNDGQLGIGSHTSQDLPQQVTTPASTGWTSVTAGDFHTCATRTHAVWCWGLNGSGQLGIGNNSSQGRPRHVTVPATSGWTLVTSGGDYTCATHSGHTLWCWGANESGQLGIGDNNGWNLPQQVTS